MLAFEMVPVTWATASCMLDTRNTELMNPAFADRSDPPITMYLKSFRCLIFVLLHGAGLCTEVANRRAATFSAEHVHAQPARRGKASQVTV